MVFETPITLIFNSFTLALAMSFLLIVLWSDIKRSLNQFFATFLVFVQLWNLGVLLSQILPIIQVAEGLSVVTQILIQSGLIGAAISLYALITALIGVQPRYFGFFVILYLSVAVGFAVVSSFTPSSDTALSQRFFAMFFSLVFNGLTLYSVWNYRRKVSSFTIGIGVIFFVGGQWFSFLNPDLLIVSLAPTISSIGSVIVSFAIIQRVLITPLIERGNQLEAMHEVSIAITSRIATDAVLGEIAERATRWLEADAAGVFLNRSEELELVAVYHLPDTWLHYRLDQPDGVVGRTVKQKTTIYLENYSRDWDGADDLPLARSTYGSVICVPLVYSDAVIGALLVISGLRGKLLDKADADLLELLAAQAAVAISYGNLFSEQRVLTEQLAIAHEQLRTVLTSTDSPVIAIDRSLKLIFTNPAAQKLFSLDTLASRSNLLGALPVTALPADYRDAVKQLRKSGTYQYELEYKDTTFLCHVATLGEYRIEGFVAILNDVTKLKELDRLKSEMVRMTSHDLKNPLQAAMANIELLKEDVLTLKDDEMLLSVNTVEKQLTKMHRIISSILDLERVRLGSKPDLICDPRQITEQAIEEVSDFAADQTVSIVLEAENELSYFLGDKDQFTRALVNLIENAIKFNQKNGTVIVKVISQGNEILFAVSDTGIGIPEHLHKRIFDRFFRGHQPGAEHISGSGLGLSLVKSVVDSHNGRVWFESISGKGTTFFIAVPAILTNKNEV